ncbi:uncharacterized protein LOC127248084 [Andrographis paniculata]|uniref:uncharacterized protein LOC127248084 n=1 Tax=Andrographis paniculata TaxID=175694 RepID=UPI0021E94B25|nr:uncharacterized protein LOC127248084 [Andrographis paniculata]
MNAAAAPTNLFCTLSPNVHPKFHTHLWNSPCLSTNSNSNLRSLQVSCRDGKKEEEVLAREVNLEIKKLNTQAEEAFQRSREMLFAELCSFVGLKSAEMRRKWRRMSDEERWGLARGFVAEWSLHLHPLSARSVKELINQHLSQSQRTITNIQPSNSSGGFFSKFLGFPLPENNQD